MWDDPGQFPYFIPIIWQGDGPNPSPNYTGRGSMYGVAGIPHSQWNGSQSIVGGGASTYGQYVNAYNQIVTQDAPIEMDISLGTNSSGQFAISANVELTDDISTTNNKIIFILTYDYSATQTPDYFASAITYGEQDFDLTSGGQIGFYEEPVTFNPSWDLTNLKGLVIVQTFSGNNLIHQAGITEYSGMLPMFSSNVTEGPANLGVEFTDNSFPSGGIDSWQWDFDGDGTFDSSQQNPYHLYTEVGEYDVTLQIEVDGEYAEVTAENYITVTDGSSITGNLSGLWESANNPYIITDEVQISQEDQLTISPGVEITVDANVQFTVYGLLNADASSDRSEPIIFTSDDEWAGIRFMDTQQNNILNNCEISKANTSAILVENDSHVDIIDNKIFENSSSSLGAAIDVTASDNVVISQNIIANNTSSNLTGGIACLDAIPEITNNLIVNNTGTYGAFSFKTGSDVTLENNTIANNESTNGTPYLFFIFNSFPTMINNIIIDNGTLFFAPFGDPTITYTCLTGGFTGEGNIDVDPLFVAPTEGDGNAYDGLNAQWWLQESSPCIDAGNPDAMYNDPDGTRNDMGAYGGPLALESGVDSDDEIVNIVRTSSMIVYPNPFNPSSAGRSPQTTIALNMTKSDQQKPVTVGIYNIKGQLVKTLVRNEIIENSNFIWNGKDNSNNSVSTGIYFIKMRTTSTQTAKKVMLLK